MANLLPTLSMPSGLDAAQISRDPEVVQIYQKTRSFTIKQLWAMASNLLKAIDWTFAHAGEFEPPLLLVHGTADQIAYPQRQPGIRQAVSGDCTLKLWDGLLHETHNEPEKDRCSGPIIAWLEQGKSFEFSSGQTPILVGKFGAHYILFV